jgi:hypothetical protein
MPRHRQNSSARASIVSKSIASRRAGGSDESKELRLEAVKVHQSEENGRTDGASFEAVVDRMLGQIRCPTLPSPVT